MSPNAWIPLFAKRYLSPVNGLPTPTGDQIAGVNDGVLRDLDGDGRADVVVLAYVQTHTAALGQSQAWVYLSRDGGFQGPAVYLGEQPNENWPGTLAVGDINRDGHLDLLVSTSSSLDLRFGAGDGTFGAELAVQAPFACNGGDMAQIDANADGLVDIQEITWNCGLLSFLNDPGNPGQLMLPAEKTTAQRAGPLAVGDFDGDGHPDLAYDTGTTLAWLPGGPNGLSYSSQALAGKSIASIATFPVGIGDALAVTSEGTLTVFSPTVSGPGNPKSYPVDIGGILAITDLNGDGLPDLLVGGGGTVDVLINLGGGTFSQAGSLRLPAARGSFIQTIAAGDFDGDGAADLVVFWGYGPWEGWINLCGPGATVDDLDAGAEVTGPNDDAGPGTIADGG